MNVKKYEGVTEDLKKKLVARSQEVFDLKDQREHQTSLEEEQRNMWVKRKLDLASQLQMHAQARKLASDQGNRSEEREKRTSGEKEVKDLEQRLWFWQHELLKVQQDNQKFQEQIKTQEEVNLILTQKVEDLQSFANSKTETIQELELLLEEERHGASKLARISNDEHKDRQLREFQGLLRMQENRNVKMLTQLSQLQTLAKENASQKKQRGENNRSVTRAERSKEESMHSSSGAKNQSNPSCSTIQYTAQPYPKHGALEEKAFPCADALKTPKKEGGMKPQGNVTLAKTPRGWGQFGGIRDLARVLSAKPDPDADVTHASKQAQHSTLQQESAILHQIIQDLTQDLRAKNKEVEELRLEAVSWGRSFRTDKR